jgi:very-short-patch-repair endonuclease
MSVGIGMISTLSRHLTHRQIAVARVAVPAVGSYMPVNRSQSVARAIEALASRQFGVFSRDQALALGATRNTVEQRVETGAWCVVLPRIYRVAVVARSLRQHAMAATLWSAPDGLISHETAATLWPFEGIATEDVHLTVPVGRSLRSTKVTVHHTNDLLPADIGMRGPIPITSPLRTAIDLAGVVDANTLEIAIESALRRGVFTVGQLRWRAEALLGTGRRGSKELRELLARRDLGTTDSGWEVRTEQVLVAAGFAAPTRQYSIRANGKEIARADLAYPDARVIHEYDSDQWHSGTARRHRDAASRNRLRALGWTVIEVTPAQLRDAPTSSPR